jgi:autotransporter-associated beta strand protein
MTATGVGNKNFTLTGTGIGSGKRGEFAGVIADSAGGVTTLFKQDSGRWALEAVNTFTGVANINNGFLEVSTIGNQGAASNLGAGTTIGFGQGTATGTLEYIGSGETTDRIIDLKTSNVGGGRIDNNGSGALIFTANTAHSGSVNDKTLTLGGTSTGFVNQFDGIINDQAAFKVGLAKAGPCTWSLGGANTYTGPTAVSAGTLLVNESTSTGAVTVASSATLGGNGTLGGTVTLDTNANLSPGAAANTAAILTISGDLDVSSAAPYTGLILMDLDAPAGTNDRINIGGQAIIGTGELGLNNFTFNNLGGLAAGSYTLISATGGISGTLDATNLAGTIAPGWNGTLAISGGNALLLTVTAGNAYDTWIASFGLTGPNAAFDFDFDKDGIANGLEWVLGGTPTANAAGTLVTATGSAASGITLNFDREEDSIGVATLTVEYGTTLASWPGSATIGATSSGPDGNGVAVTVNDVPNPDEITVNIPISNSADGKLFARLKAVLLP